MDNHGFKIEPHSIAQSYGLRGGDTSISIFGNVEHVETRFRDTSREIKTTSELFRNGLYQKVNFSASEVAGVVSKQTTTPLLPSLRGEPHESRTVRASSGSHLSRKYPPSSLEVSGLPKTQNAPRDGAKDGGVKQAEADEIGSPKCSGTQSSGSVEILDSNKSDSPLLSSPTRLAAPTGVFASSASKQWYSTPCTSTSSCSGTSSAVHSSCAAFPDHSSSATVSAASVVAPVFPSAPSTSPMLVSKPTRTGLTHDSSPHSTYSGLDDERTAPPVAGAVSSLPFGSRPGALPPELMRANIEAATPLRLSMHGRLRVNGFMQHDRSSGRRCCLESCFSPAPHVSAELRPTHECVCENGKDPQGTSALVQNTSDNLIPRSHLPSLRLHPE
ncbi:hypothetical protein B0H12DRAFT_1069884 [Mycena haematopus]|nr:hypothetical protein B0H12DRAFT_1069884 [Mycena haematopus]